MNSYNNNLIKNTPDFIYMPPERIQFKEENKSLYDYYICKFKTAIYASILFVFLSLPIAYKILDMICKLISNNIDLIDNESEDILPLGRLIMAIIVGIFIFIL